MASRQKPKFTQNIHPKSTTRLPALTGMNLGETFCETIGFHATNPFINDVEPNSERNAQVESTTAALIENVFFEIMSDYVSN